MGYRLAAIGQKNKFFVARSLCVSSANLGEGDLMKQFVAAIAVLVGFVVVPCVAPAANVADFIDFSLISGRNQVVLPGRLYVPPEATTDPTTPRPFILFMHGAGEDGTNNISQIDGNIDNLLAEAKRRGAFLYAPQTTNNWSSTSLTANVMAMIGQAKSTLNVDPYRLYVTGLSNGGGGTWNMASRYPGVFAAALPIAGVTPSSDFVASRLLNEPVWAFHARNDTVVSVNVSHNVVNSILNAAHAPLPTYPPAGSTADYFISNPDLASHRTIEDLIRSGGGVSEYQIPGSRLDLMYYELTTGGHGIWPSVYASPPVYDWLFSHTTAVPEPSALAGITMAMGFIALLAARRNAG
jgi:predicted peptidase